MESMAGDRAKMCMSMVDGMCCEVATLYWEDKILQIRFVIKKK